MGMAVNQGFAERKTLSKPLVFGLYNPNFGGGSGI
jgi:hypothetical protein